jgi:HEAT repeat protein
VTNSNSKHRLLLPLLVLVAGFVVAVTLLIRAEILGQSHPNEHSPLRTEMTDQGSHQSGNTTIPPALANADTGDWRSLLASMVAGVSREAEENLLAGAPSSIPVLIELLSDADYSVRYRAARVLAEIGPSALPAGPALLQRLGDDMEEVRVQSAVALVNMGIHDDRAVSIILDGQESDFLVRSIAWNSLHKVKITQIISIYCGQMRHPSALRRKEAAVYLGRCSQHASLCVPSLLPALHDSDSGVRMSAAIALLRLGHSRDDALRVIREVLESSTDPDVREETLGWIADLGPAGSCAVPIVLQVLDHDPVGDVRATAALVLVDVGKEHQGASACLTRALRDTEPDVRATAAEALVARGDEKSIRAVIAVALTDSAKEVRIFAAEALGKLGASARIAIPALERLAKDPSPKVRQVALEVIERIREGQ